MTPATHPGPSRRRASSVLAGLTLAAACAGCSHAAAPPRATATTSGAATSTVAVTAPTVPATATPSTTTPAGTTTLATATAATCSVPVLRLTTTSGAAAGNVEVTLVFENTGTRPCTMVGYPGVAGLDAAGRQVVQARRTANGFTGGIPAGTSPPHVLLVPGASASARVEGTDVPAGTQTSCPSYPRLLVTPPNTTTSVVVDAAMPGCSPIEVHPVVPGTTGSEPA